MLRQFDLTSSFNVTTLNPAMITFDPRKRAETLLGRGLDFADAARVFAGPTVTVEDDRRDYGEKRWITLGLLANRAVVMVWTPRQSARRIISMRHAHEDEVEEFGSRVGRW